jgi:hypothetical protein
LEHIVQEDEISFSVSWKLGLGVVWVLIKWSKDRGLEWKTWWRAVSMGLICYSDRTRVLLRNQYPWRWLAPWVFNSSIFFLCSYSELVEWPGGCICWATCLPVVSAKLWPIDMKVLSFWCPLQWKMAALWGRVATCNRAIICFALVTGDPLVVEAPFLPYLAIGRDDVVYVFW